MKFRPGTEEGDYQVKLRNLKRFLEEGDKAKVSLRFRARSRSPRNRHVTNEPNCRGPRRARVAETEPKFEGRQVIMVLAPRKNKKAPSAQAAS